jgi:hypothetical protein
MTGLRDFSNLPDDAAYWDELEARIMAELGPKVRAGESRSVEWWAPIARRAWSLGGLAAAAGIVALLFAPARHHDAYALTHGLLQLNTSDARLEPFVTSTSPPPIAALVLPPDDRGRQ